MTFIYFVGPFYWTEKGSNYKSYFRFCEEDCKFVINSFEDNCILYHNSSFIETVSCDSKHNAICAFRFLGDQSTKTFCSQQSTNCVHRNYSLTPECLCITRDTTEDNQLAVFESSWQNLAYMSLTTETCYIGLQRTDHGYSWLGAEDIAYTNWSPTVVQLPDLKYGVLSTDGWLLTKNKTEYNCSLIKKNISEITDFIIYLDYNTATKSFTIHVKYPYYWFQQKNNSFPEILCFTDATTTSLFDKLETVNDVLEEDYANFSAQPLTLKSGHYWCTGFLYPRLDIISSNKYLIR